MPNPTASPELLMPVSDEHALQQFQIEALRQITDNLRRLNDRAEETSKALNSIDNRLTKIESNAVNTKVSELQSKVDSLESDRDKRIGAISLFEWVFKHWPGIIGFLVMMAIVLRATGRLK